MEKCITVSKNEEWWIKDDGIVKYATVFIDDIPFWKPVKYNSKGAYVNTPNGKEYILEACE